MLSDHNLLFLDLFFGFLIIFFFFFHCFVLLFLLLLFLAFHGLSLLFWLLFWWDLTHLQRLFKVGVLSAFIFLLLFFFYLLFLLLIYPRNQIGPIIWVIFLTDEWQKIGHLPFLHLNLLLLLFFLSDEDRIISVPKIRHAARSINLWIVLVSLEYLWFFIFVHSSIYFCLKFKCLDFWEHGVQGCIDARKRVDISMRRENRLAWVAQNNVIPLRVKEFLHLFFIIILILNHFGKPGIFVHKARSSFPCGSILVEIHLVLRYLFRRWGLSFSRSVLFFSLHFIFL